MTPNMMKYIAVLLTAGLCLACQAEQAPLPTPISPESSVEVGHQVVPDQPVKTVAAAEQKPTSVKSTKAVKQVAADPPFKGKKLAFIHTSNMVGELEPCG